MKRSIIAGFVMLVLGMVSATQTDRASGNIRLLSGFIHRRGQGFDSVVGSIVGRDGLVIHYDIGQLAGVYTDCNSCGLTDGELWRRKQIISGREVRIVFTKSKRLVISFPHTHANFYATVRSDADLSDALLMVLTYNPSD